MDDTASSALADMVRIKHRWLLVQVLYPTSAKPNSNTHKTTHQSIEPKTSLLAAPAPTLSIHAPTPDSVNTQSLIRLIRAQLLQLFGDYGAGLANNGLAIKYWSNATSTMIVRCERATARIVWAALTFVRSLSVYEGRKSTDLPCVMQVLRVSGTIRKVEEELIRRAKAVVGQAKGLSLALEAGVSGGDVMDMSDDDMVQGDGKDVVMGSGSDDALAAG